MEKEMTFQEWVDLGVNNKWVSYPVCDTHEGTPFTEEESKDIDDGGDPCLVVMRVWG